MTSSAPDKKNLFQESPTELRRLVLLLYGLVGPVFVLVLHLEHDPDRGHWELPTIAGLVLLGAVALLARKEPKPADWILPIGVVPTVCCGIAAASCGDHGAIYMAVTAAPLAWAAVLSETFVVYIAWGVATATSLAVYTHMYGLAHAIPGTALFGTLNGLVAWTLHGKARALRALHAETKERARRHEALLAAIPDTLIRAENGGKIVDVHVPSESSTGAQPALLPAPLPSLLGRNVFDFVPDDVAPILHGAATKAIETGELQTIEYSMSYPDDSRRSYESRFVRSGPDEVIVLRRDITSRKRAERALQESEEKYRSVVNAIAEGVIVRDTEGKLLACNEAAERILGLSREELEARDFPSFLREDGAPLPLEERPRHVALRTGLPVRGRVLGMERPDGSIAWLSVSAELLRHSTEDSPYAVVITFSDVTERRLHAQRQLRDARLAGLEERINEIELVMTPEGQLVAANDKAALAYGYSRDELLHLRIRDLRAPGSQPAVSKQLARLQTDGSLRFETLHVRRDGSVFPVLVSSRTFQVDDETFVHSLIHDLTDEHRVRDQLLRSQKMESIGRLAGSIAHDFNNLLTVIQSYSVMLESDLPEDDPHRQEVSEILAAASRATTLTRRLLAASRRQIRAPRELSLADVVRASEPALRSLLGPAIDLQLALPSEPWTAHLDRAQIELVLQNLASNARAAMPTGGSLRVTITNWTNPVDPDVFGAPPPPGDYVVLTVSDTGKGIDAATRERLFEPMLTTRDAVMTTGLGLAEVHGVVSQSSGHVAVTSTPGHGASFRLYFPRFRAPEAPKALREPAAATSRRTTILIVDDDAEVRAVTRRLLSRERWDILEAADGDEALILYSKHVADIALILTDVAMPRLTGPELVARLDASGQGRPPVIFMSAYVDKASVGIDKLPPSTAFIAKPFDRASLLAMIASALPPKPGGAAAA